MRRISRLLLRHFLIVLLAVVASSLLLFLLIALHGLSDLGGTGELRGDFLSGLFEVGKFLIVISAFAFVIISPGYLVYLCLLSLPSPAPKRHPWDAVVLCFIIYVVISHFIPIGFEGQLWVYGLTDGKVFFGDKIFAVLNLLIFASMNRPAFGARRRQLNS